MQKISLKLTIFCSVYYNERHLFKITSGLARIEYRYCSDEEIEDTTSALAKLGSNKTIKQLDQGKKKGEELGSAIIGISSP